jgi:hypothetical protein
MLQLYAFPQQDRAPLHWPLDVQWALNATFLGRWIGRDGPTDWPPRSPDITTLDFFLWGYVKDREIFKTIIK